MIKTADLHPDGKYLLCSHPHGAMPAGINVATGTNVCGWDEKFPGNFSIAFYTYSPLVIKLGKKYYSTKNNNLC